MSDATVAVVFFALPFLIVALMAAWADGYLARWVGACLPRKAAPAPDYAHIAALEHEVLGLDPAHNDERVAAACAPCVRAESAAVFEQARRDLEATRADLRAKVARFREEGLTAGYIVPGSPPSTEGLAVYAFGQDEPVRAIPRT